MNLRHWIAMLHQDTMTLWTMGNLCTVIMTELVMMCISYGSLGVCVRTFHNWYANLLRKQGRAMSFLYSSFGKGKNKL